MAKSQQAWFDQLKTWVPAWFFNQPGVQEAHFKALAKILSEAEAAMEEARDNTFLSKAQGGYLDLHGSERSISRLPGEFDAQYSVRIKKKSLVSQVSKSALLEIINALLVKGKAAIKEDWEGGVFFGRSCFMNRGEIVIDPLENTFTIVVDKQIHDPYSFACRGNFMNRGDFMGTSVSSDYVFQLILEAVNDNKALGVFYRIYERPA